MKASSLRIGNIVSARHSSAFNGEWCVEADDIASQEEANTYGREYLKPILLTEEWLIKFGFQKFEEYDFGISLNKVPRFEKGSVSIMLSDGKFWYATRQYDGGTSDPYGPVIEVVYVHRLQNLYFELENEELPI